LPACPGSWPNPMRTRLPSCAAVSSSNLSTSPGLARRRPVVQRGPDQRRDLTPKALEGSGSLSALSSRRGPRPSSYHRSSPTWRRRVAHRAYQSTSRFRAGPNTSFDPRCWSSRRRHQIRYVERDIPQNFEWTNGLP
jgi:hypothetical protein